MADQPKTSRPGLLDSLAALGCSLLGIARTRLELLSTDLEAGRAQLITLLAWSLAAVFCFGVGILLASLLLLVAFWDSQRLLVLALLSGSYLLAGMALLGYVRHKARSGPRWFAASLAELDLDRQHLGRR
jgi:uncharacterized membrane protein YqjE